MITNKQTYIEIKEGLDQVVNNGEELIILRKADLEKLDNDEWKIGSIIDIIQDPKDIKELNTAFESSNINTDLTIKKAAIGQTIYVTVMLEPRNKSLAYNIGEIGVLQCKITNIYRGTTKLNQLKQAGKL